MATKPTAFINVRLAIFTAHGLVVFTEPTPSPNNMHLFMHCLDSHTITCQCNCGVW